MPRVGESRYLVMASWDDVPHLNAKAKKELLDSTPEYLREARSKGVPSLGSGAVFPYPEANIKCAPFPIPDHWPRLAAIDFGWDHPTAVSWLAWDRDTDTIYVYDCYGQSKTVIPVHAATIKAKGDWIPVAWPHDGYQVKDAMQGAQLAQQYRDQKVNMLPMHAQFEEADSEEEEKKSKVSVEAGIQEMLTRMQTGRFKVFSNLTEWFVEYRIYRREKGLIVKLMDDRLCSTRYGVMMIRFAITQPKQDDDWRRERSREFNWRAG